MGGGPGCWSPRADCGREGLAWELAALGVNQCSVPAVPVKAGCGGVSEAVFGDRLHPPSACGSRTIPAEGGRRPQTACPASRLSPHPLARRVLPWAAEPLEKAHPCRNGTGQGRDQERGRGCKVRPGRSVSRVPAPFGPRPHLQPGVHRLLPPLGPASPPPTREAARGPPGVTGSGIPAAPHDPRLNS